MVTLKPFHALLPRSDLATEVVSVLHSSSGNSDSSDQASGESKQRYNFLRTLLGDFDLSNPEKPPPAELFSIARARFEQLLAEGILEKDATESLFVYRLTTNSHEQTGVVGCLPLKEYEENLVRPHEETRHDKEEYCAQLMLSLEAHESPVFLTYRENAALQQLIAKEVQEDPIYEFVLGDGIKHTLWRVKNVIPVTNAFARIPFAYIADGHHRLAGACACRDILQKRNKNHTGEEGYNFFLAVLFPHTHVRIHAYNRLIRTLPRPKEEVLQMLRESYLVSKTENPVPEKKGLCSMYLDRQWYQLAPKPEENGSPALAENLEVSVLYRKALKPVFGIENPRSDKNLDYVSGTRGIQQLEELVDSGKAACAFSLFPTSVEELMAISDLGMTMEPKSTWFEPKLTAGLIVHSFGKST